VEQEGASTKKSKFEKLMMGKKPDHNDGDVENFYSKDPNKLDMINNLNSIKLLAVSEAFEAYPDMRVDCD
jgi:hypothetical protein